MLGRRQARVSDTFASGAVCGAPVTCCNAPREDGPASTCTAAATGTTRPSRAHLRLDLHEGLSTSGLQFAQHFVGAQLVTTSLNNANPLIGGSFVFERSGPRNLPWSTRLTLRLPAAFLWMYLSAPRLLLSAPAIEPREGIGVRLSPAHNENALARYDCGSICCDRVQTQAPESA